MSILLLESPRRLTENPRDGRWQAAFRKLIATLLFLTLPGLSTAVLAADKTSAGHQTMPAIPLVRLDGSPMSSDEWLGKPLVVNVWATWCPPCRTEMPSLQKLGKLLEPSGIGVVALSVDSDQNLVREFVLKYRIDLPVGIAAFPNQAMASLDAFALPLTLYVGADGRIVGRHVGQRDWGEESVARELRETLLEAPARKP
jgi:thiol-disulfide isomerase/thioredoxin